MIIYTLFEKFRWNLLKERIFRESAFKASIFLFYLFYENLQQINVGSKPKAINKVSTH
jgi:hypothetical protein